MSTIQIFVNGKNRETREGATIADLIRELGLERQACAVEANLVLIPKARHATHALAPGDRLEVVTLVGGG